MKQVSQEKLASIFKTVLYLVFLWILSLNAKAQGVAISEIDTSPASSAMLDVVSTSKGMLVPRMMRVERLAISSPATGLLVYQIDNHSSGDSSGFWIYTYKWSRLLTDSLRPKDVSFNGASNGQALIYNGSAVTWGNPTATTITLPFSEVYTANADTAFKVSAIGNDAIGARLSGDLAGVLGFGLASSKPNVGVGGVGVGSAGVGVRGVGVGGSGNIGGGNYGVSGNGISLGGTFSASSISGRGVEGVSTATSGITNGGYFEANSPAGYGITARNSSSSSGIAGYFLSTSSLVSPNLNVYDSNFGASFARINFQNNSGSEFWSIAAQSNENNTQFQNAFFNIYYSDLNGGTGGDVVRIDGRGNVAIGTGLSATVRLNVAGANDAIVGSSTGAGFSGMLGISSSVTGYGVFALNSANGAAGGFQTNSGLIHPHVRLIETQANDFARINFENTQATNNGIWTLAGRTNGTTTTSAFFNFFYSPNEDGSGGSDLMSIRGDGRASIGGGIDAAYGLRVYSGGVGAAGAYVNTSDKRFKTNISTIQSPLNKILNLRGVEFDWKSKAMEGYTFSDQHQLGFIAQEINQILPESVIEDANGYYSVAYSMVIPVIVEAMKELHDEVQALKKENNRLRDFVAELDALKTSMQDLQRQSQIREASLVRE